MALVRKKIISKRIELKYFINKEFASTKISLAIKLEGIWYRYERRVLTIAVEQCHFNLIRRVQIAMLSEVRYLLAKRKQNDL